MLESIFGIEKFNIISDEENYYFFRALNMADNRDIENGTTLDEFGSIKRIRTDRERYDGISKYNENSQMSLEEVFNHIKMHHRTDTNCISLTSNANAAILYGRSYYKDKYVMIKVPKKEFGEKVSTAGLYMMNEINKRIDEYLSTTELDEIQKYYLDYINYAETQEALDRILDIRKQDNNKFDMFERGINLSHSDTVSVDYQALDSEQNFQKNKLIAKLNVIQENMLPGVKNVFLVRTLGNAFSSLELIHYNDITKNEIIEIPTELMDAFALIQQLPKDNNLVEELKQRMVNFVTNNSSSLEKFKYNDYQLNNEEEYTIEKMYRLTNGNVNFFDSINLYKKSFYLAKSKLRADNLSNIIRIVTNNDPKFNDVVNYLKNNTYGVEPEIFSRINSNRLNVSESVSLDFAPKEREHFEYINGLSNEELIYILDNPTENLKNILDKFPSIEHRNVDQETYYANAIIDLFDWSKIDVVSFSSRQRNQIVNSLKNSRVVDIYNILKERGIKEKDIANALLTVVIKDKGLEKIDLKDTFTLEELEDYLGYYKINNTKGLQLRSYQANAVENIEKIFKEKQFAVAVLPTGAGKSFVALSEMLEHSNEEILYLAPNDGILNQVNNYILNYICDEDLTKTDEQKIKERFPKLRLCTYQSLVSDNKNGIINDLDRTQNTINKKYKLIIFDELHRTGAKEWESSIFKLLDHQDTDAKVLGITATPLRDMDNRNMADEWAKYFGYSDEDIIKENHIAMNMDLLEAIRLGYVVEPKVVNCEYSMQDKNGFLDKMMEIINQGSEEEKKLNLVKYDSLRRRVEQADGIGKVLNDNIKQGGKYIVFCPVINKDGKILEDEDGNEEDYRINSEDVIKKYKEELTDHLGENFDLEFYSVLGKYGRARNIRQLEEFEKDEPNKVKLMLSINLLNEGVHVPHVDGSIWYRPLDENSNILYHQQLGRVIYSVDPNKSLSDEERPTVIDLVNNTLRVNMNKETTPQESDLSKLKVAVGWIEQHDLKMPDINSSDKVESSYAVTLQHIQKKYFDYIGNNDLLNNLTEKRKIEINQIIEIGNSIDLWNAVFSEKIKNGRTISSSNELSLFQLTGIMRDYSDLYNSIVGNNSYVLRMAKNIKEYCEKYEEWPRYIKTPKNEKEELSRKLYKWIYKSGYTKGKFKYSDVKDETGQPIKGILDELQKEYYISDSKKDEYKIMMVRKIKEYCETYKEWPKKYSKPKNEQQELSRKLSSWLSHSGYSKGKFKYSDVKDETGQPIKGILDELQKEYYISDSKKDEYKIMMVRKIKEYCKNQKEWPKKYTNPKNETQRLSTILNQWIVTSGYIKGNFKYSDVKDETGKLIKETMDELHKEYYIPPLEPDEYNIMMVNKIKEYCETYKEWPKQIEKPKNEKEKLSAKLYGWIYNSGYAKGKFKYSDVKDETGKLIKEAMEELQKEYYSNIRSDEYKIMMVRKIKEYCETYKEWPKQKEKPKNEKEKLSAKLYQWLKDSGYIKDKFKYLDIIDETGKPILNTLNELYEAYSKKKFTESKKEFDKNSQFNKAVNNRKDDNLGKQL